MMDLTNCMMTTQQELEAVKRDYAELSIRFENCKLAWKKLNGQLNLKEKKPKATKRAKPFKPPSVLEVESYIKKQNYPIDPQMFVDFYEAKGWMIGKNKMKSWEAAVRTWTAKHKETELKSPKSEWDNLGKMI